MSDSDSVHSDWSDWEEDDVEEGVAQCLFSDARFPTVEEALAHDAQSTGFDLAGFRTQVCARWDGCSLLGGGLPI